MNNEINYRWIDGPTATAEEWDMIETILVSHGWMSLNRNTSRILVAERGGVMAFHVFQLLPYCGPMFVPPSMRGTGVAEELADQMVEFLGSVEARGWVVVADSPHAAKLCRERGMKELQSPVYVMVDPGGVGEG